MPFYEYECSDCKFYVESLQKISDPPIVKCPSCGKDTMQRLISAPVFRLKGAGWYETDFKSEGENKRNLADDKEPAASSDSDDKVKVRASKALKKVAAKKAGKKTAKSKKAAKPAVKPAPKSVRKPGKSGKQVAKKVAKSAAKKPVAKKSAKSASKARKKLAGKSAKKAAKKK